MSAVNAMIFIAVWIGSGLVAAAGLNASFKAEFPDQNRRERIIDRSFSLVIGFVAGPFALLAWAACTGFYYDGFSLSLGEK